jgi:uncharacterized protein YbjT (DUF2867 family)
MRIAVVGATGMLGQHVARHTLRAGRDLIALYRNPRLLNALADLRCEARQADLDDVDSLRRGLRGAVAVIVSSGQYLDGSKATRELGYRPEVSVDEAIRRTFEWFRSQEKVKIR